MALKILDELCTQCGDCEPVCPTGSIYKLKGLFAIKADSCTECDPDFDIPQCEDVCEVPDCIVPA
ncbi:MAG: 4Fe-4S binding protein [Gammaproteobacteria bacterium]